MPYFPFILPIFGSLLYLRKPFQLCMDQRVIELPRDLKALGKTVLPATFPVLTVKSGSRYLCCSFSQDSLLAGCSKMRSGSFRTILSLGVKKYKLCDSGFLSKFLSKLQG